MTHQQPNLIFIPPTFSHNLQLYFYCITVLTTLLTTLPYNFTFTHIHSYLLLDILCKIYAQVYTTFSLNLAPTQYRPEV